MSHRARVTIGGTGASDVATNSVPQGAPQVLNLKKRHPVPHAVCQVAPVDGDRLATLSFELDGVSAAFANTLRRVIMTEVPTMAIDRVLIHENDGVVLDELLSHRLGLCPVAAPAEAFEFITMGDNLDFANPSARHVLRFDLDVAVPNEPSAPPVTNVFSSSLQWVPLPGQEHLQEADAVKVVQSDILIAKLGRGQRIRLQAFAIKGMGLAHAKWTPVSACWYGMRTRVSLTRPVRGADAQRLVESCPNRVFDIEDGEAFVRKEEKCTLCRECIKVENEDLGVTVQKEKTRVKFTLESLGQYAHPEDIVRIALTSFADRCRNLKQLMQKCEVADPKA